LRVQVCMMACVHVHLFMCVYTSNAHVGTHI